MYVLDKIWHSIYVLKYNVKAALGSIIFKLTMV